MMAPIIENALAARMQATAGRAGPDRFGPERGYNLGLMATDASEDRAPIALDEICAAALATAAERDMAAMANRLFSILRGWAMPSLILCLRRDQAVGGGWRTLPELTVGQLAPGLDKTVAKLIDDAPAGSLSKPTLIRPSDDFAGLHVKLRDSWLIPWSCRETTGFLLLRGIPRPYPPNLGDAVALISQPLWPLVRLGAGPAATDALPAEPPLPRPERMKRLEDVVDDVHRAADQLRAEVRGELERLRAEAPAPAPAPPPAPSPEAGPDPRQAALEEARREVTALREKLAGFDKSREAAETEREFAKGEAAQLRSRVETLEAQVETDLSRADAERKSELGRAEQDRKALEESRSAARASEAALAKRSAELEDARQQLETLEHKVESLEKALAEVQTERDKARGEGHQLWISLESLQRQLQVEKERFQSEKAALDSGQRGQQQAADEAVALRAAAERERDEAKATAEAAVAQSRQAEEKARLLEERWEKTLGSFRGALEALRRTPFVPPTLRVSFSAAEGYLDAEAGAPEGKAASRTMRILFLDRDTPTLEHLAADLETAGVEVLIAHYPEEVSFFLKTPDCRRLAAAVCDVMAFRADQDLSDLFRSWRRDLPDLALLLSYKADNPTELERAKRVPVVLATGHIPRPLQREALLDAIAIIAKKHAVQQAASQPLPTRPLPEKGR